MLELDVQLTADGALIVQHDDTVDKTTEATGPVSELTLAEIQALDNAYWFSPFCWPCQDRPLDEYVYRGVRTGEIPPPDGYSADDFRVPTFREIATAFPDLPLDIEIKGELPAAADVAEHLANELAELGRIDSAVVVSFDDAVVDVFHELAPDVAISPGDDRLTDWFLTGEPLEPYFEVLQLPPFQLGIQVIDDTVVQRIHDEGRIVWVWPDDASTQENAEFYKVLIGYGVDGIIAGRPAEVTAALDGAAG
jgi:glycerophosphoryl diester phosphodiesterase